MPPSCQLKKQMTYGAARDYNIPSLYLWRSSELILVSTRIFTELKVNSEEISLFIQSFRKTVPYSFSYLLKKQYFRVFSKEFFSGTVAIISLLSVNLVIYIVILVYQNSMIDTSHKIFLSLFHNYYQRDKFMNLLNIILSNAF